jgi:N-acetylneuraminic acid mutarotase
MLSVLLAALWVGPAMSGSWYTPERNGEGFTLQVLDNGTAHALWFTYPPAGSPGQQAWIYASGGRIEGDRIVFTGAFTTRGPRFGPGFDPAAVRFVPWGTLEFRFTGCNEARFAYAGPASWGSGSRTVTRLTALAELECSGKRQVSASGARTLAGLRSRSGAWFDPAHNGEGWSVEELPDGRAQVYWFTYDADGEQAWTIGVSPTSGTRMVVADNYRPVGARFGSAFDPAQVQLQRWGRLELDLDSCLAGAARYESTQAGFGSGTLVPTRLTVPAGAVCLDGSPGVPQGATWSRGAAEPQPVSESANAVVGSSIYMAGGFGNTRGFKRFEAQSDTWTVLAETPAGRDHSLAAAIGDSIYVTGGNHNGGGDHSSQGWRYVIAENRWEAIATLPGVTQSAGAALAGFAYFSDINGNLTQFDPRTRTTRQILGAAGNVPRDHSQLVEFQGELWLIGGRQVNVRETARVSIYDPASETWRQGPNLGLARAGFAAAATRELLVVAGGELLCCQPWRVAASVEAIAAGGDQWRALPDLPTPLHGFGGIIHGNAFYTVGGTVAPGAVSNAGIVQVLRW